jgi:hypothetical protein
MVQGVAFYDDAASGELPDNFTKNNVHFGHWKLEVMK